MIEEVLPDIAESDLEAFFQITHTIYGYDFRDYARASALRRLGTILKKYGLPDVKALNQRLLKQKEFFETFLSEFTIGTTELFRDPSAWVALRKQALPLFLSTSQIRIWHAGTSTGEEVLSLAILLTEMGSTPERRFSPQISTRRPSRPPLKPVTPSATSALTRKTFNKSYPTSLFPDTLTKKATNSSLTPSSSKMSASSDTTSSATNPSPASK